MLRLLLLASTNEGNLPLLWTITGLLDEPQEESSDLGFGFCSTVLWRTGKGKSLLLSGLPEPALIFVLGFVLILIGMLRR
jgi:hypothetical protein